MFYILCSSKNLRIGILIRSRIKNDEFDVQDRQGKGCETVAEGLQRKSRERQRVYCQNIFNEKIIL